MDRIGEVILWSSYNWMIITQYFPSFPSITGWIFPSISHFFSLFSIISQHFPLFPIISQYFPFFPIISHFPPSFPNISQYFPLFPSVSHCFPLFPISSHCFPLFPSISLKIEFPWQDILNRMGEAILRSSSNWVITLNRQRTMMMPLPITDPN